MEGGGLFRDISEIVVDNFSVGSFAVVVMAISIHMCRHAGTGGGGGGGEGFAVFL